MKKLLPATVAISACGLFLCGISPNVVSGQTGSEDQKQARIEKLEKEIQQLRQKLSTAKSTSGTESATDEASSDSLSNKAKKASQFLKKNLLDEKQLEQLITKGKVIAGDLETELNRYLQSDEFKKESESLNKLVGEFKNWSSKQKDALTKSAEDKVAEHSIKNIRKMVDDSIKAELPRITEILEYARQEAKKAGVDFDKKEVQKVQRLAEVTIENSLNQLEQMATITLTQGNGGTTGGNSNRSVKIDPLKKKELAYAANLYNLQELKKNSSPEAAAHLDKAIEALKRDHALLLLEHRKKTQETKKEEKKGSFFSRLKKKAAAATKKLKQKLDEPVDNKLEKKPADENELMNKLKMELESLKKEIKDLNKQN